MGSGSLADVVLADVALTDVALSGPVTSVILVAVVLVAHELGHYLIAGIAGVPASDRRIVFAALPPHVALPAGDDWVSPFDRERFRAAYGRYDPERQYAPLFTAGGFLGQVALVGLVVVAALASGHGVDGRAIGADIVSTSLGFTVVYLAIDLVMAARKRSAFGDTTHLWRLSPWCALATHLAFFGSHGLALLVLAA